jgi:hypothetical protein
MEMVGLSRKGRRRGRPFMMNSAPHEFRRNRRACWQRINERQDHPMRTALLCATALVAAAPALADEKAVAAATGGPVGVSVSYSLTVPLDAAKSQEDQERAYLKAMYVRSAKECQDLTATIASSCQITNISASSQINSYPGQAATIYVNASVTMQIAMKP